MLELMLREIIYCLYALCFQHVINHVSVSKLVVCCGSCAMSAVAQTCHSAHHCVFFLLAEIYNVFYVIIASYVMTST